MTNNFKKTKIVATIGPATQSVENLIKLSNAGMNIARINFSHGTKEELTEIAENIKKAEKKNGKIIGLLQDVQGPKIRTGDFENGEIELKKGKKIEITSKNILGTSEKFSINIKTLFEDTEIGDRIILNDGYQELKIVKKNKKDKSIIAKIINGGKIKNRRGVSFPDSNLSLSSLTKKDKEDIAWFATKYKPDFLAFSFVKTAKDVKELKNILKKHKINPMIIAKMETAEGIRNFDEILELVDGIMVARGDLGVEFPTEEVPFLQKMMINKTNLAGKPVIVATQMLESMIQNPVPTRAEVSDIANAVLDGADAVMLSAETSVGKYPQKAIQIMSKTVLKTENDLKNEFFKRENISTNIQNINNIVNEKNETSQEINKIIPEYSVKTAQSINAKLLTVFTETGLTAKNIASFKSNLPIYVFSPNIEILRKTSIFYGLFPATTEIVNNILEAEKVAKNFLKNNKILKKGDKFVLTAGIPFRQAGSTNLIYVSKN